MLGAITTWYFKPWPRRIPRYDCGMKELATKGDKEKIMALKVDKKRTALLVMDFQKHVVDQQSSMAQHAGAVSVPP
jgi:hypothetical protein